MKIGRWLASTALILLGPIAVSLCLLLVDHHIPAMTSPGAAAWLWLVAAWTTGIVGVHLLPIQSGDRVVIAVLYTPIAGLAIIMTLFSVGCSWYSQCI